MSVVHYTEKITKTVVRPEQNNMNKIDLCGTHIPALTKLLSLNNPEPVLELGAGYNSTPILYWNCKANNRKFVSYENYKDWCDKVGGITTFTDNWDMIDIDNTFWDIALIDHRPALRRKTDAVRLKNNARFVVLHDSEPEIDRFYHYSRVYKHFKYRYDFKNIKPYTTILSNFEDPTPIFYDQREQDLINSYCSDDCCE